MLSEKLDDICEDLEMPDISLLCGSKPTPWVNKRRTTALYTENTAQNRGVWPYTDALVTSAWYCKSNSRDSKCSFCDTCPNGVFPEKAPRLTSALLPINDVNSAIWPFCAAQCSMLNYIDALPSTLYSVAHADSWGGGNANNATTLKGSSKFQHTREYLLPYSGSTPEYSLIILRWTPRIFHHGSYSLCWNILICKTYMPISYLTFSLLKKIMANVYESIIHHTSLITHHVLRVKSLKLTGSRRLLTTKCRFIAGQYDDAA